MRERQPTIDPFEQGIDQLRCLLADQRFAPRLDDDALLALVAEHQLVGKMELDDWRDWAANPRHVRRFLEDLESDCELQRQKLAAASKPRSAAPKGEGAVLATIENEPPARKPELCGFDEVQPLATRWIWPGRVAKGWLTLVAGEGGAGKSLVLMDLVSRVSRGDAFPCGHEGEARARRIGSEPNALREVNVLLLARDGLENVVQPRLAAAGADLKRIQFLRNFPDTDEQGQPVTRAFCVEKDLPAVEEALADDPSIALFVIDGCCLAPDSRRRGFSEGSRRTLLKLQELARRRQVAVVVAVTIESQAAGNELRRWLDKLLAITEDHFVLAVIRDRRRGARRLLLTLRSALGEVEDGLGFETPGGRVVWGRGGVSATVLHASAGRLDQLDAARWLREELVFGPRAAKDLRAAADEAGHPWHVIYRAKAIAGADCHRQGFGPEGQFFWSLREGEGGEGEGEQEAVGRRQEQGESGQEAMGRRQEEAQKDAEFPIENKKTGQAEDGCHEPPGVEIRVPTHLIGPLSLALPSLHRVVTRVWTNEREIERQRQADLDLLRVFDELLGPEPCEDEDEEEAHAKAQSRKEGEENAVCEARSSEQEGADLDCDAGQKDAELPIENKKTGQPQEKGESEKEQGESLETGEAAEPPEASSHEERGNKGHGRQIEEAAERPDVRSHAQRGNEEHTFSDPAAADPKPSPMRIRIVPRDELSPMDRGEGVPYLEQRVWIQRGDYAPLPVCGLGSDSLWTLLTTEPIPPELEREIERVLRERKDRGMKQRLREWKWARGR